MCRLLNFKLCSVFKTHSNTKLHKVFILIYWVPEYILSTFTILHTSYINARLCVNHIPYDMQTLYFSMVYGRCNFILVKYYYFYPCSSVLFCWQCGNRVMGRGLFQSKCVILPLYMMTSSNGIISRVTGHLCGEFTAHRWIAHTNASDAELWCLLWSAPE